MELKELGIVKRGYDTYIRPRSTQLVFKASSAHGLSFWYCWASREGMVDTVRLMAEPVCPIINPAKSLKMAQTFILLFHILVLEGSLAISYWSVNRPRKICSSRRVNEEHRAEVGVHTTTYSSKSSCYLDGVRQPLGAKEPEDNSRGDLVCLLIGFTHQAGFYGRRGRIFPRRVLV